MTSIDSFREKYEEVFDHFNLPFNQWFINLNDFKQMSQISNSMIYHVVHEATNKNFSLQTRQTIYKYLYIYRDINFYQDLHINHKLNHRSILKFYGFNPGDQNKDPVILTEYTPYGTLGYFLDQEREAEKPNAQWTSAKKLINIYEIASAMKYLHSKNIIFRNLSRDSILLDESLYPKLFDFRFSLDFNKYNDEISRQSCSPQYAAPETNKNRGYSTKSDVYAFSLIVYEIVTNERLTNQDLTNNLQKGKRPQFTKEIPAFLQDLINKCWSENPNDRPSFDQIIDILKTYDYMFFNSKDEGKEYFHHVHNCYQLDSDNNLKNKYQKLSLIRHECDYDIFKIQEKSSKIIEIDKFLMAKVFSKFKEEQLSIHEKHHILIQFDYPSILRYFGYSLFDFDDFNHLTTINEYAPFSLKCILDSTKESKIRKSWSSTTIIINIYGIASGMKYLHSLGYIHCNLSTEIIFESDQYYPKITGFEQMKNVPDNSNQQSKRNTFLSRYSAPEVIKGGEYTKSSDVYSFSYILYELVTNKKPFEVFDSEPQILKEVCKGYRPEIPSSVPICYKKLIQSCWSEDPDSRPTFSKIVHKLEISEDFMHEQIGTTNINDNEFQQYVKEHIKCQNTQLYDVFDKKIGTTIDIDHFEKLKIIRKNKYAKIATVQNKITKEIFQAKILHKEIEEMNEDEINHLKLEVEILYKLKHKAIVKYIGFSSCDFKGYHRPVILTEYEHYELRDIIKQENSMKPILNSVKKLIILYGIASVMNQLHQNNIVNLNLTSESILLDESFCPRFSDFRLCLDVSDQKNENKDECMKKSDIYSFGLIAYEILTHKIPYEDDSTLTTKTQSGLQFGKEIPFVYSNLIQKCLKIFPFDRPSFAEIIDMLKSPDFISILNNEDQKEEYFNYIYSIESEFVNIFKYQMIDKICDKLNSTIFKIQEKLTGKLFAAKVYIKGNDELPKEYINQKKLDKILLGFNHLSLLKYIGYNPLNFQYKPFLTIINEYAQSSLFDLLEKTEHGGQIEGWTSTKKLINIYGIASGMQYLHFLSYIHRNLSIDNILEDENFYPKITGFNGISQTFNVDYEFYYYPKYAAPEVIKNHQYSKASDVYSFSIILYELVTNKKPFTEFKSELQIQDAVCKGYRPEIPKSIPNVYKRLIEMCWSENPYLRPQFSQIVHQLKTDEDFIFYDANQEEFEYYIKLFDQQAEFNNEIRDINLNDYERLDKIGQGSFSKIYKVRNKKTSKIFAAKVSFYENDSLAESDKLNIMRELKIMSQLNHPTILKFYGFSPVNFNHEPRDTYIIEFGENGSMYDIINLERKGLCPDEWNSTKKHINIFGIALGMEYIHSLNIIHRDLKPQNILLDEYLNPKICDFGLSKQLHQNTYSMTPQSEFGLKGTIVYMAPETLKQYQHSKSSDVYAFGMLLYTLFSEALVYEGMNHFQIMMNVLNGKRPEFSSSFPEKYKSLITNCWAQKPENRPKFAEIVQLLKTEEFLEGIDKKSFFEYVEHCDYFHVKNSSKYFNKVKTHLKINKEIPDDFVFPDVQTIDLSIFDKKEKLGSGGFGKVYKVVNKSNSETFAAKILKNQLADLEEKELINFKRELEIISKIQHQAIIKFIGYSSENFSNKPKPVIVSELVPNGSLSSVLLNESKGLVIDGWDDTKKLINIYGIAAAMKYMHSKSFLHRDLKTDNILLDEYLYPKLCDFGLSKVYSTKICEINSYILGTPPFIAPEILKYNEYSQASDVYAYSLIVYEIMTNKRPFVELVLKEIIYHKVANNCYRPKFDILIPKCYQDLIEICWSQDPYQRPSFDEIIETIKSNPEFITTNIDMDEFINYTEEIGESYLPENKRERKERVKKELTKISRADAQNKINEKILTTFNRIVETKMSNQSIQNYFLDLNDYEQKDLIRRSEFSKIYKVIEKRTGESFSARLSNIDMTLFKDEEMTSIALEFNLISQINHPAILHFVGFSPHSFKNEPRPVVITELSINRTLGDVLQMDRKNIRVSGWNATKKLINIYGIASAMKCLHSLDIVHRNLNPNSIMMSDSCHPKLSDFGICTHLLMINSMMSQTASTVQESHVYSAPENLLSDEYTKASDVYSFAMITYEIITKERPVVQSRGQSGILSSIASNRRRPEFKNSIPDCYRNMIESGWSENPDERPSFDQIVDALENDPEFITPDVNKQQYLEYIQSTK